MLTIGLTYDLKDDYIAAGLSLEEAAEFDSRETIDALDNSLAAAGHTVDRIGNLRALMHRLLRGDRWDMVFNIAEGVRGPGRESEIPCLLEAFSIPYTFSDPMVLGLCLHKGMTKHVVRDAGIPTPDFRVIESEADLGSVSLSYPVFAKPVAEGTGKGVSTLSRIENPESLQAIVTELLKRFKQPVLVEEYLPGREFTVGILGTGPEARVIGGMEILYGKTADGNIYSYSNKAQYETRISYVPIAGPIQEKVYRLALSSYRVLGCRDGGRVDVREDDEGEPQFLEVNPLPGLHPVHSDLPILASLQGLTYGELIRGILSSALKRNTRLY